MNGVYLLLLVAALTCFLMEAFDRRFLLHDRPLALLPLGLAFWVAVPVIEYARVVF